MNCVHYDPQYGNCSDHHRADALISFIMFYTGYILRVNYVATPGFELTFTLLKSTMGAYQDVLLIPLYY